jgi:hypothetical protein
MYKKILSATKMLILTTGILICISATNKNVNSNIQKTMTVDQIKQSLTGSWVSIAPELRPSIIKNTDGSMKPFYLTRAFKYSAGDKFELEVINSADSYGKVPLVKIVIKGHIVWQGDHPIASGAQKVDFIADDAYEVTPLIQGFCDAINKAPSIGINKWEVNVMQNLKGKSFPAFGLVEGQTYTEYDLIYILNDMLFWGAKNVDGRGFDKIENRPTNLQIPLVRKK